MNYSQDQKDKMRERLKKIAKTKIQTTMIYPLNQFEISFGHLWGFGKKEENLTNDEKANRMKWNEIRDNILNMGNRQIRGFCNELNLHEVIWQRYTTEFIVIGKQGNIKGATDESQGI